MVVEERSLKQAGLTGLYLGVFATVWFSVPKSDGLLRTLLVIGSVAGLATAVCGMAVLGRARREPAVERDRAADRRYLLIVVPEFAAAGLGAWLLAVAGPREYIPVLVSAVVGAHFFPLVPVLRDPRLRVLGAVVCAVAAAALVTGLATAVEAGLLAGAGTGLALLGYAVSTLAGALRRG
ncbi:hypothetical protein AB0J72_08390 [Dactylosporangium sp. NPDC049742]|uniref:hypothetical protein n=1 Tax=Dactylosporangium sp. NPDC049742 TaxID=3154737 RepID=UPI003426E764